jgi:hypothetical protein
VFLLSKSASRTKLERAVVDSACPKHFVIGTTSTGQGAPRNIYQ